MSDHRLRPAVVGDLPTILRAERDYVAAVEPAQLAAWTAAIDRNLGLWIAHLDRTTVLEADDETGPTTAGFVMWMPDGDAGVPGDGPAVPSATLITLQVLPTHRRRGLGTRLLETFATQAGAAGSRVLRLGVHEANPARGLYPQAGYVLVGRNGDYLLYERAAPPSRA